MNGMLCGLDTMKRLDERRERTTPGRVDATLGSGLRKRARARQDEGRGKSDRTGPDKLLFIPCSWS